MGEGEVLIKFILFMIFSFENLAFLSLTWVYSAPPMIYPYLEMHNFTILPALVPRITWKLVSTDRMLTDSIEYFTFLVLTSYNPLLFIVKIPIW